jgi:short-subunit dehydrogenase
MNILITGASTGIGKALAYRFAADSHNLFLLARNETALYGICEDISSRGLATANYLKCDVTVKTQLKDGIMSALSNLGKIDIAVLNSGIGGKYFFAKPDRKAFDDVMATNFFSVIDAMELLLPDMLNANNGMIAVVSSMADVRGFAGSAPYGAGKAALTIALESARAELEPKGITISTIRPGFVKSGITARNNFKMPFLMETDKAADLICRALYKKKRHIDFPFRMRVLTNLLNCLPDWLFDKVNQSISK